MDDDDVPLAWGDDVSPEEVGAAFNAICDGHTDSMLLRLLRVDGVFIGFEVAALGMRGGSSAPRSVGPAPPMR